MKQLSKDDFILDPCVATPGFEFLCRRSTKVDLDSFVKSIKHKNIYLEKDSSPFFVIIKSKFGETTIFNNLKIIVRVSTKEEAYEILALLLESINSSLQG